MKLARERFNVSAASGTVTLALTDNPYQDFTNPPSAVKLPTGAALLKGTIYCLKNSSITTDMAVQSSGANAIDIIRGGYIVLEALVDNPTGTADWKVVEVYEAFTVTSSTTPTGFTGSIVQTAIIRRFNKNVECNFIHTGTLTRSSGSSIVYNVIAALTRLAPTGQVGVIAQGFVNGAYSANAFGIAASTPNLEIFKDVARGAFAGSDTFTTQVDIPVTWAIA